jgi:hypothetical protein
LNITRKAIEDDQAEKLIANDKAVRRELLTRLGDYERQNPSDLRDRLVARWKAAHPDAAAETSAAFHPLVRLEEFVKSNPSEPDEIWFNDLYNVTVRRHKKDPVFGSGGGMIQIGICAFDGSARHDFREMQAIKNQLAGEETEGFELFPAESRLLDPSNYYTLWCFPGVRRLRIGQPDRLVRDADVAWAPQRRLANPE